MIDFTELKNVRSRLSKAIISNDIACVERLLQKSFMNLNYLDESGNTPLHLTASKGSVQIVKLLVAHGASQHIQDAQGFFPLHVASFCGHIPLMMFLLDAKNFEHQACLFVEGESKRTKSKTRKQGKEDKTRLLDDEEESEEDCSFSLNH